MSERRKALLRDADDPKSGLSDDARSFIKDTDGKMFLRDMKFNMRCHFILKRHLKVRKH